MSLDKKAILKEIEVLIRSIKVHYDNIENEHRIPTIELELITSKIRKLHEKSIIYNHLHYMEEEQLQSTKRLKLDHIIFKHTVDNDQVDSVNIESAKNALFDAQIAFEKKVATLEQKTEEHSPIEESKTEIESSAEITQKVALVDNAEPNPKTSFKKISLASKIGINDRFRFIKNLFGGSGTDMESAINELEQCLTQQELDSCINSLKAKHQWNEEDETVIDFLALVK